jgi:predicted GIY-YIG superfamily endonuclease
VAEPVKEADSDMKDYEYFVYIVCSRSGTLYIGMTNNIYRRALQHKRGETEGFSCKYHCDRLVYFESFEGDRPRKAIEGMAPGEEDRINRIEECSLGGSGGKMGSRDVVCW